MKRCRDCSETDRKCLCVNHDGTARYPANWDRLVKRQPDPLVYALPWPDQQRLSVSGRVWRAGVGESVLAAVASLTLARAGAMVLVWDEKRRFAAVETGLPKTTVGATRGDDYRLLLGPLGGAYRRAVSRIKLAVGADLAPSQRAAKRKREMEKPRKT